MIRLQVNFGLAIVGALVPLAIDLNNFRPATILGDEGFSLRKVYSLDLSEVLYCLFS